MTIKKKTYYERAVVPQHMHEEFTRLSQQTGIKKCRVIKKAIHQFIQEHKGNG